MWRDSHRWIHCNVDDCFVHAYSNCGVDKTNFRQQSSQCIHQLNAVPSPKTKGCVQQPFSFTQRHHSGISNRVCEARETIANVLPKLLSDHSNPTQRRVWSNREGTVTLASLQVVKGGGHTVKKVESAVQSPGSREKTPHLRKTQNSKTFHSHFRESIIIPKKD